jgi:hypothetical protein
VPREAVVGAPVLEVPLEPAADHELGVLVHGHVALIEEPVDVGSPHRAPPIGVELDVRGLEHGQGVLPGDGAAAA